MKLSVAPELHFDGNMDMQSHDSLALKKLINSNDVPTKKQLTMKYLSVPNQIKSSSSEKYELNII